MAQKGKIKFWTDESFREYVFNKGKKIKTSRERSTD